MVGLLGAISEQEQQGLLDPMPRRQPVGLLDLLRAIPEAFGNAGRAGLEGYAQALAGFDNEGRTIGNILPLAKDERTGEMSLASPRILDLWNTLGGVGGRGVTLGAGPSIKSSGKTTSRIATDDILDVAAKDTEAMQGSAPMYRILNDQRGVIPGNITELNRGLQARESFGYVDPPEYSIEEIASGWENTRRAIREKHGNEVTLYRADAPRAEHVGGMSLLYMGDEYLARQFANNGREARPFRVPVDAIVAVNAQPNGYHEFIVDWARVEPLQSRAAPGSLGTADRRLNWRDAEDML